MHSSNPTTEQILKRAEDMMREDQEYLKDFNAAVDQLQKRQAEFQGEHPDFGSRYSQTRERIYRFFQKPAPREKPHDDVRPVLRRGPERK